MVEQLRHPRTLCNMTMPSDNKIFTPFLFTPFTPKPSVQFETTGVFSWNFLLKPQRFFSSAESETLPLGPPRRVVRIHDGQGVMGFYRWAKIEEMQKLWLKTTPKKYIKPWKLGVICVKLFGSWVIEYPKFQQVNCFVFGICSLRKASGMNVPPQLIRAD